VPIIILAAWWILWHTDVWFTQITHRYPCCGHAVMVRAVVPWPTAFVWISWAITLWLLAWITAIFAPKVNRQEMAESTIVDTLKPA